MRTYYNSQDKRIIAIRLSNGGFTYEYDLPYAQTGIHRHNSKNWSLVHKSKEFIQNYMNSIHGFMVSKLGRDYDSRIFYNRTLQRCDIVAVTREESYFEIVSITFEPGTPSDIYYNRF